MPYRTMFAPLLARHLHLRFLFLGLAVGCLISPWTGCAPDASSTSAGPTSAGHRTAPGHLTNSAGDAVSPGDVAAEQGDAASTRRQDALQEPELAVSGASGGTSERADRSQDSGRSGGAESAGPAAGGVEQAPKRARPAIRPARSDGPIDITFDDLELEMPVGTLFEPSMLTPRVKQLDGKTVRLRGFIYAGGVFQSSGIKSFPFVMNTQCKFGPQGLAYCVVLVELVEGVTTDFTSYPITVEGKLTVRPFNSGGFTWSVYHMQGTRVY